MLLEPLDKPIVKGAKTRSLHLQKRLETKDHPGNLKVSFLFSSMHVPAEKAGTDQIEGCNSRDTTDVLCEHLWFFLSPKQSGLKSDFW